MRILMALACAGILFIAHAPVFSQADDQDGDGFSDAAEIYMGTSPMGRCIPTDQEYDGIDMWPVDLNRDNRVDVSDVTAELLWYGSDVNKGFDDPAFNFTGPRYDLAPDVMGGDGFVDIQDLIQIAERFGQTC